VSSRGRLPRTHRIAFGAALLTTIGTGLVALPVAPAEASITTLCSGYSSCAAKGMGNAGYSAVNRTSYWRMFSGHNCTNYAAYRMTRAGLPNARPWTGGGNATNWGAKESRITNGVPRVGAIAWWKAGVKPAGSAGHVAYVERVVSANEVILSQDSWNGDFSWTRITRSGGGWPSGFIHFRDVPLRATAGARITGFTKVGSALRVTSPTWSPAATRVTYQWLQNGAAIPGATGATYVPSNAQLGKRLSVRASGTRYGYPTSVVAAAATSAVLPGTLRAAVNPTLRGRAQLGRVLSATPGTWTPRPDAVSFRWLSGGRVIRGATRSTFVATPSSVGRSIAVQVIASRRGYDDVVRTFSYRAVAPGQMPAVGRASLVGTPRLGKVLRLRMPRVPRGARATIQWVHATDGRVVRRGATAYRIGAGDLGSRLVAKVWVSRFGYRTQAVGTRPTAVVRTTPTMRVLTARGAQGIATYLTVRAPGLAHVGGLVAATSRGHVVARIPVRNGVGRATIRRLPRGRSTIRFTYVQNSHVARVSVSRHVRR
jgi:surface antigen